MIVTIDNLKPGMILARPLMGSGAQVLLSAGAVLDDKTIRKLARRGIEACFIALDGEHISADVSAPLPESLERMRDKMRGILDAVASNRSIRRTAIQEIQELIQEIIDDVCSDPNAVLCGIGTIAEHDHYTLEHSVGVMVAALVLARRAGERELLRLEAPGYRNLGMGALFHDIGKMMLPLDVLNKRTPLDPREWEMVRRHPLEGLRIVRQFDIISPMSRAVVLNHHQHWDGKGYGGYEGRRILGKRIPVLVRIVSIADSYDAMVSNRPYREAYLPAEAVRIVRDGAGSMFDPELAALIGDVAVSYPSGSILALGNGLLVAVIEEDRTMKDKPVCLVLASFVESGSEMPGRAVDLRKSQETICFGVTSIGNLKARMEQLLREKTPCPFLDAIRKESGGSLPPLYAVSNWDVLLQKTFPPEFRSLLTLHNPM